MSVITIEGTGQRPEHDGGQEAEEQHAAECEVGGGEVVHQ
jgi:hypothetical protein